MKCKKILIFILMNILISALSNKVSSSSLNEKNNLKKSELKFERKKSHKKYHQNGSKNNNASNKTKNNNNNNTNQSQTNSTNTTEVIILNSVGRKVFVSNITDIILTKFPFRVTRCDQTVMFNGSFITDMKDYRSRSNGTFTISAHYANLYLNFPDRLLKSNLLSESSMAPRIVPGTGGCIFIFAPESDHTISICLEKDDSQNILEVLKVFSQCRGGLAITQLDPLKIAHMISNCSGKGKFVNPYKLLKALRDKKKNIPITNMDTKWFHPGYNGVPGTINPTIDGSAPDRLHHHNVLIQPTPKGLDEVRR